MSDNENNQVESNEKFDWLTFLRRKDRPLPKTGCSWAFYIVLLLMVIYLVVMFLKYKGA